MKKSPALAFLVGIIVAILVGYYFHQKVLQGHRNPSAKYPTSEDWKRKSNEEVSNATLPYSFGIGAGAGTVVFIIVYLLTPKKK